VRAWDVKAARYKHEYPCCKREYRLLGTVLAETMNDALDRSLDFTDKLTDDESVCIGLPRPASVYELLLNPQVG
jgi:hypothetical protein